MNSKGKATDSERRTAKEEERGGERNEIRTLGED